MDNLVTQVMNKLRQREQNSFSLTYNQQIAPPADQVFIDYGKIIVKNISINLIIDLYRVNSSNPWVKWILEGISYDVRFQLLIIKQMINFVPKTMVLDWPLLFVVDNESPLVASHNHLISRSELAALPDNSILIQTQSQKFTDEASDICRLKNIEIKMRTEENCIWQK
ncbi:PduM family microcompartment protein [Lactobacillus sp. XV13L]|nr:PduM family microcompartment protein [Lactobacillus sp. XV13L]